MALRLKIRKEIKLTLEDDGCTHEEIKEQFNDLVEEGLNERRRIEERDLNERRITEERKLQHELESKRINSSIEIEAKENAKIDNQHQKDKSI